MYISYHKTSRMSEEKSILHIRPRFSFKVKKNPQELHERIQDLKQKHEGKVVINTSGDHIILDIPGVERHFSTPQLWFRIEQESQDSKQFVVKGLVGPRPEVWTMFVFFYFSIGILGFAISSYAAATWLVGKFSHLIWAFPIAILIMLTAYLAGKEGEKLGHDQMERLKSFLREVLEE